MAKKKKAKVQEMDEVRVTVCLPASVAAWAMAKAEQVGLKLSPWIRTQLVALKRADEQ